MSKGSCEGPIVAYPKRILGNKFQVKVVEREILEHTETEKCKDRLMEKGLLPRLWVVNVIGILTIGAVIHQLVLLTVCVIW